MADAKQTLADLDAEIARQDTALVDQVEALAREAAEWIAKVRELVRRANGIESAIVGRQINHSHGAISAIVEDLAGLLTALPAHRRRQQRTREEADRRSAHAAEQSARARARADQRRRNLEALLQSPPAGLGRIDLGELSELLLRRT